MNKQNKQDKKTKENKIFSSFWLIYGLIIFLVFIALIIYYAKTNYFSYVSGWILPIPFAVLGMYLHLKIPDWLLKRAKNYGEYAKKPKGFMLFSSFLYISSYALYVIPFIIIGVISVNANVSLTNSHGWFNIYCALCSVFLLPILLFMVKFWSYIINKK